MNPHLQYRLMLSVLRWYVQASYDLIEARWHAAKIRQRIRKAA
jgi:hypothetical protein